MKLACVVDVSLLMHLTRSAISMRVEDQVDDAGLRYLISEIWDMHPVVRFSIDKAVSGEK